MKIPCYWYDSISKKTGHIIQFLVLGDNSVIAVIQTPYNTLVTQYINMITIQEGPE